MANYPARTKENACVFCEIGSKRLQTPGLFWEDGRFMAFLSSHPNTEGFTCVIPKAHFGSDILKMPDDDLRDLIIASKRVSNILEHYFTDVGRVGLIMEGTGIDHAHTKLIPLHGTEFLKNGAWKQVLSQKECWFDAYEGWVCSADGPESPAEARSELAREIMESNSTVSSSRC